MVGEIGSMSMNSGSALGLETSPHVYHRGPGSGSSFMRGSGSVQAQGWTRQPANVGDVAITMNSYSPMQELLHGYFSRYVNDANREAFGALVDNRVAGLEEMGHDADRIRQNMNKANRFDWGAAGVAGAVNAIPFALASLALDTVPALSDLTDGSAAKGGAFSGLFAGAADVVGGKLLWPSLQNINWTKAPPEQMESVMQHALVANMPDQRIGAAQSGLGLQGYTVRNVLQTAATPLAQSIGGTATRLAVNSAFGVVGGIGAGAIAGAAARYFDERNGMAGPALLFGHKDWRNIYTQLDAATWTSQAGNALARVGAFPGDVATGTLGAVQSLFTPSGLGEQVLLTTGFAGINAAKQAVVQSATAAGMNQPAAQFLGQVANTVLSAPLYAALPPVMLGADYLAGAASNAIQSSGWSNTPASAEATALATMPTSVPATTQITAQMPHTAVDLGGGETTALIPGNGLRARAVQTTEV